MRAGTWGGAVSTDNVRVTVDGVVRPVSSVRITSGMRDGHPLAESGSWCVEATITWADPAGVSVDAPEPWSGESWLPRAGADVVIETGDGALGQWWVQHRGKIDDTTGSIADGTAVSTTVDMIDDLSGSVSFGALMSRMPPSPGSTEYRDMGMQSTFLVDRMMRRAQGDAFGWYATPPRTWQTLGSVPGQGSLWPEVGTLISCGHRSTAGAGPAWSKTIYGVAPTNHVAETRLISATPVPILTTGVWGGSGAATLRVVDDNGVGFHIQYDGAEDRVRVSTRGVSPLSTYSLPRQGVTRAALYARRVTGGQEMTLRLSDGREETFSPTAAAFPSGWAATRVLADSDGATLGWWLCEGDKPSSQRWSTLEHSPTARLRIGDHPWWIAARDVVSEDPAQWLGEQVDAECAAMWLDEDGVMQWAGRGVLDSLSVAQTVTSDLDVDDIQWQSRRRALAKSVVLTWDQPRVDMGWQGRTNRTLWEDDSVEVGPGETETIPVSVPSDQDWIGVDLSPHHITGYGHTAAYYTEGSIFGGTQVRASDSEDQAWAGFVACTMSKDGARDYTITYGAWSSMSGSHRLKSSFPTTTTAFVRSGAAALALRSQARLIWAEREQSMGAGANGLSTYTHTVGWRVQDSTGNVNNLLTFLAGVMSSRTPTVTGLVLSHDPRRQVGDKIRVQDRHVTGRWVDVLVQQREVDVDDMTESISGRVTASGAIAGLNLQHPAGPTALTPVTDWTKRTF